MSSSQLKKTYFLIQEKFRDYKEIFYFSGYNRGFPVSYETKETAEKAMEWLNESYEYDKPTREVIKIRITKC